MLRTGGSMSSYDLSVPAWMYHCCQPVHSLDACGEEATHYRNGYPYCDHHRKGT